MGPWGAVGNATQTAFQFNLLSHGARCVRGSGCSVGANAALSSAAVPGPAAKCAGAIVLKSHLNKYMHTHI